MEFADDIEIALTLVKRVASDTNALLTCLMELLDDGRDTKCECDILYFSDDEGDWIFFK